MTIQPITAITAQGVHRQLGLTRSMHDAARIEFCGVVFVRERRGLYREDA